MTVSKQAEKNILTHLSTISLLLIPDTGGSDADGSDMSAGEGRASPDAGTMHKSRPGSPTKGIGCFDLEPASPPPMMKEKTKSHLKRTHSKILAKGMVVGEPVGVTQFRHDFNAAALMLRHLGTFVSAVRKHQSRIFVDPITGDLRAEFGKEGGDDKLKKSEAMALQERLEKAPRPMHQMCVLHGGVNSHGIFSGVEQSPYLASWRETRMGHVFEDLADLECSLLFECTPLYGRAMKGKGLRFTNSLYSGSGHMKQWMMRLIEREGAIARKLQQMKLAEMRKSSDFWKQRASVDMGGGGEGDMDVAADETIAEGMAAGGVAAGTGGKKKKSLKDMLADEEGKKMEEEARQKKLAVRLGGATVSGKILAMMQLELPGESDMDYAKGADDSKLFEV
jgi:hypothetical protein